MRNFKFKLKIKKKYGNVPNILCSVEYCHYYHENIFIANVAYHRKINRFIDPFKI